MDESAYYDQMCRFLLRQSGEPLVLFLMRMTPAQMRFESFLDSVLSVPNLKESICDTIALLSDRERHGFPVAALFEFQTVPDFDLFARFMISGGLLLRTVKPSEHPGDRYDLVSVIVNLTGKGNSSRRMLVGQGAWALEPIEWNLSDLGAATVLDEVAAGKVPADVLAWVPLMQQGHEDDIIRRWRELTDREPSLERRGRYAMAALFAEKAGCREAWKKGIEGLTMKEPKFVEEYVERGLIRGRAEGKAEGKALLLVRILQKRFGPLPSEIVSPIQGCTDDGRLDTWTDKAIDASSLEQFRKEAGL